MKTMILSDLITSKNSFVALYSTTIFVGIFISIMTGTLLTGVAAIAAMVPFTYLFSITAYDEQNGWERFRLTLPITRKQVVYGRYASTALVMLCSFVLACLVGLIMGYICSLMPGSNIPEGLKLTTYDFTLIFLVALVTQLIILVACTITLPLIMRFGMTKGAHIAPVVIVLALSFGIVFTDGTDAFAFLNIFTNEVTVQLTLTITTVVLIALYVVSAYISGKLYQQREL